MLKKIAESPYLNLLSGIILLLTSAYEIVVTTDEALIGVRHGILLFSISQMIKAIPDIMHGLSEIEEADEILEQK
jgi:hypothetical protein